MLASILITTLILSVGNIFCMDTKKTEDTASFLQNIVLDDNGKFVALPIDSQANEKDKNGDLFQDQFFLPTDMKEQIVINPQIQNFSLASEIDKHSEALIWLSAYENFKKDLVKLSDKLVTDHKKKQD